jgi:hypothetical protein
MSWAGYSDETCEAPCPRCDAPAHEYSRHGSLLWSDRAPWACAQCGARGWVRVDEDELRLEEACDA